MSQLIRGVVTKQGTPTIELEVDGQHVQAVIDTGFNGELELPERLKSCVQAQHVGRVISLLAANQRVEEDVYLVNFPFDGQIVRAEATFIEGDGILVGTGMLMDYQLRVDFPGKMVSLKKI